MATAPARAQDGWTRNLRRAAELAVSLLMLVALLRTFIAGGYMIETGSMAPCLNGQHRRAACPGCHYTFAVEGSSSSLAVSCPNCGTGGIETAELITHPGDHLLVHRGAFEFRDPRRWEVVVFKNPNRPTQAYVKRVVALPGEELRIVDGDILINGRMATKPYSSQRGMRILVHDHARQPAGDDPDWQPRWRAEREGSHWIDEDGVFRFIPPETAAADEEVAGLDWVAYRHWVRSGGWHRTSVQIDAWPPEVPLPAGGTGSLQFDQSARVLVCRGALPAAERDRLASKTSNLAFRRALWMLHEASHIAPVTDAYGYNRGLDGAGRHEVRDLMFEARVSLRGSRGRFVIAMDDGAARFDCTFDLGQGTVSLRDAATGNLLRTGRLPRSLAERFAVVEASLMDRQFLLAVDGELPFEPYVDAATPRRGNTPWRPVMFAAGQLTAEVTGIMLYRDVYYTSPAGAAGTSAPVVLGADHFFALGDNSPVSKDSRAWPAGNALTRNLFLGKPVVVHLPSRRCRARWAGIEADFRIPEPSRIRYIR